jgi:NAD-dependent SIR2 family protein deacetylase
MSSWAMQDLCRYRGARFCVYTKVSTWGENPLCTALTGLSQSTHVFRFSTRHQGRGIILQADCIVIAAFTTNVDGHFQKAGFEDRQLEECHGSLHHLRCLRPRSNDIWGADAVVPLIDTELCRWQGELPRCPKCGAVARPNILMFGDFEWIEARSDAQRVRRNRWLANVERPAIIEMGAGVDIPSVRHFGHALVRGKGARLIRLNPRESAVPSSMDVGWAIGALEGLLRIQDEM